LSEQDCIEHRRGDDGLPIRMRLVEMSTHRIRLKKDDWSVIHSPQLEYSLPFPHPA
jgi:hypothetical protein